MHKDRPAFGQRLAELAELGVIEFRPEPLDAIVERRLKTIWEERSCPHCGADSLHALNGSDRIWLAAVTGNYVHAKNALLRFGTHPR